MKFEAKDFALRVKTELEERLVACDPPMLSSSLRDVNLERIELEDTRANIDLVVYSDFYSWKGSVYLGG